MFEFSSEINTEKKPFDFIYNSKTGYFYIIMCDRDSYSWFQEELIAVNKVDGLIVKRLKIPNPRLACIRLGEDDNIYMGFFQSISVYDKYSLSILKTFNFDHIVDNFVILNDLYFLTNKVKYSIDFLESSLCIYDFQNNLVSQIKVDGL